MEAIHQIGCFKLETLILVALSTFVDLSVFSHPGKGNQIQILSAYAFKQKKKQCRSRNKISFVHENMYTTHAEIQSHAQRIPAFDELDLPLSAIRLMNFQYEQSRNQGKESDLLTFYFTIRFQTNYKETHFLHLRYLYEEVVVTKRSAVKHSFVASSNTEKRTKRIQIACDWHYAEVDKMINAAAANGSSSSKCANSRNVRMALPSHLLIAVFEFVKPSKYLALYSCLATHTDLDAVQVDEMNRRYFHLSNIEWVTNYFGVEPWHFVKLFKVLMEFINHHKVYRYVQEEKQYNQRWRELQIAQREL
eukprot:CAMPEP_0197053792 /NCGR_PEP_ID=MMETSP1384-20130603/27950_1 /TAXON_ID=29189 /ORGANISM="Ammonia sp." /LENGTH=305 /DNA_ID=CAMNT_0042486739 /DNA_START=146 /DNA_END=1064 /DNA_ORIENTATION=+